MKKSIITFLIIIILLIAVFYFLKSRNKAFDVRATISVAEAMANRDTSGYARAFSPREFRFPEDHGSHPEFRTEWWYFTGNLRTENGRHFGFQFTIFRNSISPDSLQRTSHWASNQIYMGHFAVTDVESKKFHSFERFSRGANQLAGAQAKPFRVWLEDWAVEAINKKSEDPIPVMRIRAEENDVSIDFTLRSTKPIMLQGDQGLSQKGSEAGNASYYYSLTRLEAEGIIQIENDRSNVSGLAWLDREWSTSALDTNQVGWDWFSLQLDDGREIMYYQIRNRNGQADEFSSGKIIESDGETRRILSEEITIDVLKKWKSPRGGEYPSRWKINIPKEKMELKIIPFLENQELDVSVRYWEGAVQINGTANGVLITGQGYVELTGYAEGIFQISSRTNIK